MIDPQSGKMVSDPTANKVTESFARGFPEEGGEQSNRVVERGQTRAGVFNYATGAMIGLQTEGVGDGLFFCLKLDNRVNFAQQCLLITITVVEFCTAPSVEFHSGQKPV